MLVVVEEFAQPAERAAVLVFPGVGVRRCVMRIIPVVMVAVLLLSLMFVAHSARLRFQPSRFCTMTDRQRTTAEVTARLAAD
jgi:hypothetical protein